ncbi:MAG: class I SAM-dependent methyltransferase [Myxococcota bacterium]
MASKPTSTAGYAEQSSALFERYEAVDPAKLYAWLTPDFPEAPADVIDIGAGTGRDAGWLANLGHRVVAVEPVPELREGARLLHSHPHIRWVDDHLPHLSNLGDLTFDLILLSAVWMHFDREERAASMATLARLARPHACLGLSLRHGPIPEGRRMFDVSKAETIELATTYGFRHFVFHSTDQPGRDHRQPGVTWTRLGFRFGER